MSQVVRDTSPSLSLGRARLIIKGARASGGYNVSRSIPETQKGPPVVLDQKLRGLDMSPTVGINELRVRLQKEGKQVYNFGLGQSPFPVPQFMVDNLKHFAKEKDYLPTRGLPELREAVAQFSNEYTNLNVTKDDVIIGPGSKELMYGLQLCYYGQLIMARGSWVSYQPQAQIVGRSFHWIDSTFEAKYKVTPGSLAALCSQDPYRPRLLLLNYPSNPTGQRYSRDELEELAEVCRTYRVLVLSDEIYAPLQFDGNEPHCSIAEFYPEGTVVSTGVSKWAGAGGWRMGAFVFPEPMRWLLDSMSTLASETFTSVSAPIQYASVEPFTNFYGPEMQEYLRIKNRTLTGLGNYCTKRLEACGAMVNKPQGGFYIFPDFQNAPALPNIEKKWRKHKDFPAEVPFTNVDLSHFLLEDMGLAQLPGKHFGRVKDFNSRMAFVDFEGESILEDKANLPESADQMEPFLWKHCPRVLKGMDALEDYFKSHE